MRDIRNSDGKLVAQFDETSKEIVIVHRGYMTKLHVSNNGTLNISNTKDKPTKIA